MFRQSVPCISSLAGMRVTSRCCSPRWEIFAPHCSAASLDAPPEVHTKRIQYGQICTRVLWRIVHSPFAANWWCWQSARTLFPDRYKELIAWHPTWWIALEKNAEFPKLRRTQDLSDAAMDYAGPIRDRTAAGKLIDTVEDMFDLCRYHHILLQTPHGKACAYKEMGKCPAPCDGSVPLEWYHKQIRAAFRYIRDEGAGGGIGKSGGWRRCCG